MLLDLKQFKEQNRRRIRATFRAARRVVIEAGDDFTDIFETLAPVDTGRYKRSYQEAMVQAGGKPRPLEELRAGSNQRFMDLLRRQLDRLGKHIEWRERRIEAWFPQDRPRPTAVRSWYQKELRKIATLRQRYARAAAHLRKAEAEVGMNPSTPILYIGSGAGRKLATVRTMYYGGVGRVMDRNNVVAISLRSREPHAMIVNSKKKTIAVASLFAKDRAIVRARQIVKGL